VSAAWGDATEVRDIYQMLRTRGWHITRAWAEDVTGIDDEDNLAAEAARVVGAIAAADVLLVLVKNPEYAYRGLTYEVGVAICLGVRIVLATALPSTCYTMENMALAHPSIARVDTLHAALEALED